MAGPKVAKKLVDTVAEVASKGRSKAEEILAGIKTAEEAVSLKGPEREAYLRALDEVHGPREQRAKDMGFGDKTLYHGTPTPDFAEFDKNKNIFLTDNPNYADEYTVSMGGRADKFLNEPNKDTPSILPLNMRTNRHVDLTTSSGQADYLKYLESKGYAAGDEAYDDAVNAFKSNNSWTLENSLDTDYYLQSKKATSLETLEDGNTNIRVNNPNQIRSTNAAFDPRFKDSPLLLAGQGAAALGLGAAAFGGSEAEASPASAVQKAVKAATKTDAQKIIDSIKTAEQAVALKGPEREAYLKALDEVQGPRDKRRRVDYEMPDDRLYHGTKANINSFDLEKLGASTGAKSAKKGFFLTDNPKVADNYSLYATPAPLNKVEIEKISESIKNLRQQQNSIYSEALKASLPEGVFKKSDPRFGSPLHANEIRINGSEAEKAALQQAVKNMSPQMQSVEKELSPLTKKLDLQNFDSSWYDTEPYGFGENILPVHARTKNPLIKENTGSYRDNSYSRLIKDAEAGKNDSVIMKNASDDPMPSRWDTGPEKGTNVVVFEPSQIRSVNAAFDTRFKDSPLLLAGQGAAALGLGAAAFGGSEAEASPASAVQKAVKAATKTDAQKIIDSIKAAEQAVALKGPEREAYLKALDEVYGPREKRAKGMGFGDEIYYHGTQTGTPAGIEAFNLKKAGERTGDDHGRPSVFMSSNPSIASDYSEMLDYDLRSGGDLIFERNAVYPLRVRGPNVGFPEIKTTGYSAEKIQDALEQTSNSHNALFPNMADSLSFSRDKTGKTLAVPDAARVRSVNAAFDPRFKDSPLLLAGAGAIPALSPSEQEKVGQYIQKPKAQQILETMEAQRDALPQDPAFSQLAGTGTFRDTGRQSEGIGESLDSMFGVPARQALLELGQKNFNKDAAKRIAESFGTDPMQKPTGVDVALEMTDNPYLGTAIATASDMAGMPVGTAAPLGIRASVKAVKGLKPDQVQDLRRLVEKVKKAKAAGEPIQLAPGMAKDSQFGIKQFIANKQNEIDAVQAAAQQRRATELDVASKLPPNGLIKPSDIAVDENILNVAKNYAAQKNLKIEVPKSLPKVNKDRAKKIAAAFDEMKHNPDDPEVQKAYSALINETLDQYQAIKKSGLKVTPIKPGQENPYKSSKDLVKDLKENNHMYYFPTEQGFGSGGKDFSNHPLYADTSELFERKPMKANDVFRIVHDYFGHGKYGTKFGAQGEEAAWRAHKQMFSPEAQKALTTETRGQNSWVNYGPKGEANRANPANTTYADQKAGLLPDWALEED